MRTHGTLTKWNDERGFGFIAPAGGGDEIFVHVSAFPRDGIWPHLNELVSFETEAGPSGKVQAVRIMRPGSQRPAQRPDRRRPRTTASRVPSALVAAVTLGAIAYGVANYRAVMLRDDAAPATSITRTAPAAPDPAFTCDDRNRCPQMTSCAEATFFLQHCPNPQMDGDGDGVPCEDQWCKVQDRD